MSTTDPEVLCTPAILALTTATEAATAHGMPHLAKALAGLRRNVRAAIHREMDRALAATQKHVDESCTGTPLFTIEAPIHTVNESNTRGGWGKKHKERGDIRPVLAMVLRANANAQRFKPPLPCVVRITRISAGSLDQNSLGSALKSAQDSCADWIGVDDRNAALVRYVLAQEQCRAKVFGIRVEVFGVEQSQARSA